MKETDVVPKKTEDDHDLTDQTSVKVEPTLSYENEAFILDLAPSSDNIVDVRNIKYIFYSIYYFHDL